MEIAFAFVFGAVVGSFLNVCIDRLPRGQSVAAPPSRCDACARRLTPFELVPVVSYLALRGRCRTCGTAIPIRVLAVELLTGLLYTLIVYRFGVSLEAALAVAYVAVLIAIAFIDLEHRRILNVLTYPAIGLALVLALVWPGRSPLAFLLGGVLGGGVLLLLSLLSPQGMGYGDVKLGFLLGVMLGYPVVLVGVFLAFVLGGGVAAALLALRRVRRGQAIAFGPYLALGGVIALLYGDRLLMWWLARI